ncbi:hypothetical protein AZH53_08130 [Methanomicrobiaceae archaeon CYW5]|uniref:ZPR1 zinc finger domain-containing protein n=1 Tax=Methanovulcanius yangii TaxID=1789227 RepID=UPI0029CA07BB|nr:ZPR1 zinc finger domain-containing protein [Methanovulcanius yangii]MBT8508369.1 hypothetical protein [Methanovulcanius yangii]
MRRVIVAPCPFCSTEIEYLYQTEEIPYFSDILLTTAICPSCGFRSVDVMVLGEGEPVRYEFSVSEPKDLEARVVRSTTGLLQIPELGILVEPGPACEGFITNVEGVLQRLEEVMDRILTWAEGQEHDTAVALKEKIREARDGGVPFTLIVQDEDGNSAIIHPAAVKCEPVKMTEDEC